MNKQERKSRIIARGEIGGHGHIIVGEAIVRNHNGEILIDVNGECSIRHLLEKAWLDGQDVWTEEHADISLTDLPDQVRQGDVMLEKIAERTYKYIPQIEYDPYQDLIRQVRD